MSYFNMVCDSCGREVYGCNIVNGMKFCAKCYQETFGETDKDKQIAELKKQLEEKEKIIQMQQNIKRYDIGEILTENIKLKQQLQSQPAEIVEKIRKWGQKHYNWVGNGTGYDGQDYNECIGFNKAIDQLNEVLDTILKEY